MDAEQPHGLVADRAEAVRDVGRQRHAVAGLQPLGRVFLALQPDIGLALDDEQQLGVGMPVHRRDVARRRGLDAGAHRRVAVGDQRMVESERPELDAGGVGELGDLQRLKSGHWNSLRGLSGGPDGDTVQDARGTRKPATGRALEAAAPIPSPAAPHKEPGGCVTQVTQRALQSGLASRQATRRRSTLANLQPDSATGRDEWQSH